MTGCVLPEVQQRTLLIASLVRDRAKVFGDWCGASGEAKLRLWQQWKSYGRRIERAQDMSLIVDAQKRLFEEVV
jgi:hypothetical protein